MTTTDHTAHEAAAKKIIERIGKTIIMGVPLGVGKPIGIINAFYRLACQDKSIQLTIITGLTLSRPALHSELEKRFVGPLLDRILKNYEDPLYERARELQQVPDNIRIIEFFLSPGKYLHNSYVQQNYINSNYTTVARDTLHFSVNVVAQQVAHSAENPDQYSLSCNSDLFLQVADGIRKSFSDEKQFAIVAETNKNLPFMHGDAVIKKDFFTDIIDTGQYPALFAVPRDTISVQDHLIGLYTSALIKDDSCLQVGIGKLSNAVANALVMRHQKNDAYQELCDKLSIKEKFGKTISLLGSLAPFDKGLYASTEMLSDEYMQLYKADILKKRVYDHAGLQQLLNEQKISEIISPDILDVLLENHIIQARLTVADVKFLQKFGIVKPSIEYSEGEFVLSSGQKVPADLTSPSAKQDIISSCLGASLQTGKIMHAGFILGSVELYQWLNSLTSAELEKIDMTSIARTNDLFWSPDILRLQRQDARFVNAAMMVTLGGIVISDGLKDVQEVSGVGGQFDFVNMAQKLDGARSIINCHSVRKSKKGIESNIIWQYPNVTIPRHLRDIMVTEYGIADCRSKVDAEVMQEILNVTDSRFQPKLLEQAKKAGKIRSDYEIPKQFQQNYPEVIESIVRPFQAKGYFKLYPFGSDLTDDELVLGKALMYLQGCSKLKLVMLMIAALFDWRSDGKYQKYLLRMKLDKPSSLQEFLYKRLLKLVIA